MRTLLSTIGSRGDVQPLVALALQLTDLGQEVRMCVPPDFRDWIEALGVSVTPIGPALRSTAKVAPSARPPTADEVRRMREATVEAQFGTIAAAARGCGLIVGATALQVAAPSIAERMGIPYVFAAYCPCVLPSPRHPPPVLAMLGDEPAPPAVDYRAGWDRDARRWNESWRSLINARREGLGLAPVRDVRSYVLTDRPWLAADPTLAPWPDPTDPAVFQTGAWMVEDTRPLAAELEAFLDAGEPPIYFGFGSVRAPAELGRVVVESARAVGRRAIVSRGWADLAPADGQVDCLSVGEVNQQLLFQRVAVVVHHGGAGTTTAAARAGAPQVVMPQHYDQHYFAARVEALGIGSAHAPGAPTTSSMTRALERALRGDVLEAAASLAPAVRLDGALTAARHLLARASSRPAGA